MKKSIAIILGIILSLTMIACGKDVHPDKDIKNTNVYQFLGNREIDKITVCADGYIDAVRGGYKLSGDYKVLSEINSVTDINKFIKMFTGWTYMDNIIPGNITTENRVSFLVGESMFITCSLEMTEVEDKGLVYVGSINDYNCMMPKKFGDWARELYNEKYATASNISNISSEMLVDAKKYESIDFTKFDADYEMRDAFRDGYVVVRLGSYNNQINDIKALSRLIETQSVDCGISRALKTYFGDYSNIYNCVIPTLEEFNFNRVICYFYESKLVGVLYISVCSNIEGCETVSDYYKMATLRYYKDNNINKAYDRENVDYFDETIYYDRPTVDDMYIKTYFWNMSSLEKNEYKSIAYNYVEGNESSFYITSDSVDAESYSAYIGTSGDDCIVFAKGLVDKVH